MIELLVAVGIIVVLVGFLVPALNAARSSSRTLQCISNQRQIMQGLALYCNDSDGMFFPYQPVDGNGTWWQSWLRDVINPDSNCYHCPAADRPNLTGSWYVWGSATTEYYDAYVTVGHSNNYCSYGWNFALDPTGWSSSGWINQAAILRNLQQGPPIVAVADCVWGGFGGDSIIGSSLETPPQETLTGGQTHGYSWTGGIARCFINRHRGRIVVGMTDGSAQSIPLRDLWGGVRMNAQGIDRRSLIEAEQPRLNFPPGT